MIQSFIFNPMRHPIFQSFMPNLMCHPVKSSLFKMPHYNYEVLSMFSTAVKKLKPGV